MDAAGRWANLSEDQRRRLDHLADLLQATDRVVVAAHGQHHILGREAGRLYGLTELLGGRRQLGVERRDALGSQGKEDGLDGLDFGPPRRLWLVLRRRGAGREEQADRYCAAHTLTAVKLALAPTVKSAN